MLFYISFRYTVQWLGIYPCILWMVLLEDHLLDRNHWVKGIYVDR